MDILESMDDLEMRGLLAKALDWNMTPTGNCFAYYNARLDAAITALRITTRNDPKQGQVTLVLGIEEAKALRDVLSIVGGDPRCTRRALIDRIFITLGDAGVKSMYDTVISSKDYDYEGLVTFKETPK